MCLCWGYWEEPAETERKVAICNLALGNGSRELDFLACWKMGAPCRDAWHKHTHTVKIWKAPAPKIMISRLKLWLIPVCFPNLSQRLLVATDFSVTPWTAFIIHFLCIKSIYQLCFQIFTQPLLDLQENLSTCHIHTYQNNREFIKTITLWFSRCFNSPFTVPIRRNREDVSAQLSHFIPCGRSSCSPAAIKCFSVFEILGCDHYIMGWYE